MDTRERDRLLRRGVAETIVESELIELLDSGRSLRLKMGFDPSAPDIHLGHAVGLRKLRQLQELGHKLVLIVGDWTAQIGDPSGRSQTRKMLSAEEVLRNAETYMAQFFKLVDRDKTEVRFQSEWFGEFSLNNVIELTSRFTVAQILARDDFASRYKANQPIAITELLYPLLQAYDSVPIESDVEFGGTDQKFNLLVGRDLQQMMGMPPQQCFLVPLLPGTDGVQKMSKSLGNYIGIDEPPNEIFGKTMSLPDWMIVPYFEYLTDVSDDDLEEIEGAIADGSVNPMELKKRLAGELVGTVPRPRRRTRGAPVLRAHRAVGEVPRGHSRLRAAGAVRPGGQEAQPRPGRRRARQQRQRGAPTNLPRSGASGRREGADGLLRLPAGARRHPQGGPKAYGAARNQRLADWRTQQVDRPTVKPVSQTVAARLTDHAAPQDALAPNAWSPAPD